MSRKGSMKGHSIYESIGEPVGTSLRIHSEALGVVFVEFFQILCLGERGEGFFYMVFAMYP